MKFIIAAIIAVVLGLIGLGYYLSPNDLARCGEKPSQEPGCVKADAIIAVSGGDTNARTGEAIKLYQNGWADTLLFSGAALDKSGPSNAEAMRQLALAAGVPDKAIIVEEMSETTHENASETRALLLEHDIQTIILVTSAYHQRRAGLEFKERMGGTVKVLNHPVATDNQWSPMWWATPIGWWLMLGELFKIGAFYMGSTR